MRRTFTTILATISASGNITPEIDLGHSGVLQGIIIPTSWTSAGITFQVSDSHKKDGDTFIDSYDETGVEISISAGSSRHISLLPDQFAGARFLKIRSGTSSTPVTQVAEIIMTLQVENGER